MLNLLPVPSHGNEAPGGGCEFKCPHCSLWIAMAISARGKAHHEMLAWSQARLSVFNDEQHDGRQSPNVLTPDSARRDTVAQFPSTDPQPSIQINVDRSGLSEPPAASTVSNPIATSKNSAAVPTPAAAAPKLNSPKSSASTTRLKGKEKAADRPAPVVVASSVKDRPVEKEKGKASAPGSPATPARAKSHIPPFNPDPNNQFQSAMTGFGKSFISVLSNSNNQTPVAANPLLPPAAGGRMPFSFDVNIPVMEESVDSQEDDCRSPAAFRSLRKHGSMAAGGRSHHELPVTRNRLMSVKSFTSNHARSEDGSSAFGVAPTSMSGLRRPSREVAAAVTGGAGALRKVRRKAVKLTIEPSEVVPPADDDPTTAGHELTPASPSRHNKIYQSTDAKDVPVMARLWKRIKLFRIAMAKLPALDDAHLLLQLSDVGYVLFSVFLCCLAVFLLNAQSRPWLINDVTSDLVIVAQVFTLVWTITRFVVRNRDSTDSFMVNDTVGDTVKKYVKSVAFWLDLIVVIPVEWMVLPLMAGREMSWWSYAAPSSMLGNPLLANTTTSVPIFSSTVASVPATGGYQGRKEWEASAAVFSFLMLRHFLRYWRIASLISSSNPIVSERSIFRFLTAVSIALAVLCTCAVAFQTWEGPTLAPQLSAGVGRPSTYATTAIPSDVDEGAVTTPVLFASFDALYWSMTTALTVGYGDITPTTPGGRAIAMLTMIVGTALLSTMTAIATSFFANKDPVQQELEERMRKMTSMLEYFEVPWELQRDVIASFPAVMEAHSRAAFIELINFLPEICRNRVEGYSRLRLLRRIHLFEGIDREHAFMLAKCLTQQFVAAQDTVVMQGELGDEMYFIVHGMLDVVVEVPPNEGNGGVGEQIVVATLRDGAFFGERGLLEQTPRGASVVSITLTELLVLTRNDFQNIVCNIPEILEVFRRNVFKQNGGPPKKETPAVESEEEKEEATTIDKNEASVNNIPNPDDNKRNELGEGSYMSTAECAVKIPPLIITAVAPSTDCHGPGDDNVGVPLLDNDPDSEGAGVSDGPEEQQPLPPPAAHATFEFTFNTPTGSWQDRGFGFPRSESGNGTA